MAETSREELESKYKKAVKTLDGEKRAAIKKAKSTKGKKAKEAVTAAEAEYETKLQNLDKAHEVTVKAFSTEAVVIADGRAEQSSTKNDASTTTTSIPAESSAAPVPELSEKERKMEKARRKKQKQKEKELEAQRRLEEEEANAGPSMRGIELSQIQSTLTPLDLQVMEVEADGHCLYRAVAAQLNNIENKDGGMHTYLDIRAVCAETLRTHAEEFAPFCEYSGAISSFDGYVEQVRNSAEWGGHLELRALSRALQRPISVYSLNQGGETPLTIQDDSDNSSDKQPIRLSYHLHYYALGEHYNQVVVETSS